MIPEGAAFVHTAVVAAKHRLKSNIDNNGCHLSRHRVVKPNVIPCHVCKTQCSMHTRCGTVIRMQVVQTSRVRCFLHCTGRTSTRPSSFSSLDMVSYIHPKTVYTQHVKNYQDSIYQRLSVNSWYLHTKPTQDADAAAQTQLRPLYKFGKAGTNADRQCNSMPLPLPNMLSPAVSTS